MVWTVYDKVGVCNYKRVQLTLDGPVGWGYVFGRRGEEGVQGMDGVQVN